jgi:hypothetical protein
MFTQEHLTITFQSYIEREKYLRNIHFFSGHSLSTHRILAAVGMYTSKIGITFLCIDVNEWWNGAHLNFPQARSSSLLAFRPIFIPVDC